MKKLLYLLTFFLLASICQAQVKIEIPVTINGTQSAFAVNYPKNIVNVDSIIWHYRDSVKLNITTKDTTVLNYKYKDTTILRITYKDTVITQPPATTTVNVTFQQIATELQNGGRGVEQWHNAFDVPVYGAGVKAMDVYFRFGWYQVEGATQGSYNWTYLDGLINTAITNRQKFSFGIMTLNPDGGGVSYAGGSSYYPQYLHTLMQSESVKDWIKGGVWVPNYNSPNYQNRLLALNQAINAHLETGSFNGVRYKDVIGYIDVRGYGSWGEWHHGSLVDNMSEFPAGELPTSSSLKKIIDAHLLGFPNYKLVAMIAGFDAGSTGIPLFYSPADVAYYLLTAKNNAGEIGIRRDQWGATDAYIAGLMENNTASYNGVALKTLIMNKWKVAPVVGEPPSWNDGDFAALPGQVKLYHACSFGNGNYGAAINSTITANVKSASFYAGHRLTIRTASVTTGPTTTITLNWENKNNGGIDWTPSYENWDVIYSVNGNVIGKSVFNPRLFTGAKSISDSFTGVPKGTLTVKVVDPAGYRKPVSLAIAGQNVDGSYSITTLQ
jgi:hypothetical protein